MMIWLFSVSFDNSFEVNDDIISFKHEFYDPLLKIKRPPKTKHNFIISNDWLVYLTIKEHINERL